MHSFHSRDSGNRDNCKKERMRGESMSVQFLWTFTQTSFSRPKFWMSYVSFYNRASNVQVHSIFCLQRRETEVSNETHYLSKGKGKRRRKRKRKKHCYINRFFLLGFWLCRTKFLMIFFLSLKQCSFTVPAWCRTIKKGKVISE